MVALSQAQTERINQTIWYWNININELLYSFVFEFLYWKTIKKKGGEEYWNTGGSGVSESVWVSLITLNDNEYDDCGLPGLIQPITN